MFSVNTDDVHGQVMQTLNAHYAKLIDIATTLCF